MNTVFAAVAIAWLGTIQGRKILDLSPWTDEDRVLDITRRRIVPAVGRGENWVIAAGDDGPVITRWLAEHPEAPDPRGVLQIVLCTAILVSEGEHGVDELTARMTSECIKAITRAEAT